MRYVFAQNTERVMNDKLDELIERAKKKEMTAAEKERQRRSWAYGTAKLENDDITRELIDQAAEDLSRSDKDGSGS